MYLGFPQLKPFGKIKLEGRKTFLKGFCLCFEGFSSLSPREFWDFASCTIKVLDWTSSVECKVCNKQKEFEGVGGWLGEAG